MGLLLKTRSRREWDGERKKEVERHEGAAGCPDG